MNPVVRVNFPVVGWNEKRGRLEAWNLLYRSPELGIWLNVTRHYVVPKMHQVALFNIAGIHTITCCGTALFSNGRYR